jgi:hypothetical protein
MGVEIQDAGCPPLPASRPGSVRLHVGIFSIKQNVDRPVFFSKPWKGAPAMTGWPAYMRCGFNREAALLTSLLHDLLN